jgi:hypothetical protein
MAWLAIVKRDTGIHVIKMEINWDFQRLIDGLLWARLIWNIPIKS